MANGGEVIFKFTGETKGLENAEKKANSVLAGVGKTALKTAGIISAAIGGALVGIVTQSVKARGAIEQSIGGVETLFKKNADEVIKNANRAYKTAGVDANKYMEQVTSFSASLLQGLKGDTKKAVTYADTAITDMADNANKFGTSIEMIQNAYQGFAKQNFTMLDNLKLGYGGTKTEMKRLIDDANKVKKANGQMANLSIESFADMVEAIHIIQEEMGVTGTTAKEAEKTLTGSVASMKASWQNFLSGSGNLAQVIETGKIAMDNLVRIVKESLPDIWNGIREIAPKYIQEIMDKLKPLIKDTISFLKDVFNWGKVAFGNIAKFGVDALTKLVRLIKNTVNALKPFKELIAIVGASFVAWRVGANITKGLTLAMKGAKNATLGYKIVVGAFNKVQAIWNGLVTASKTIVALLTGKITLAEIATKLWASAQALLNKAMSSNMLGVILSGTTLLVGGIMALVHWTNKYTAEEEASIQKTKEMAEESQKAREEIKKMTEARQESLTGILSQGDYLQKLTQELRNMADESGRVSEQDKARAKFILGELNKALGTEYTMTGNVIDNYRKLQSEINTLIEKKTAELMLQAYEEDYVQLIKKRKDYTSRLSDAYDELTKAKNNYVQKDSKANKKILDNAQTTVNNLLIEGAELYGGIEQYQTATTELIKGNFADVNSILDAEPTEFRKMWFKINEETKQGHYKVSAETETIVRQLGNKTGLLYKENGVNFIKNQQAGMLSQKNNLNNTSYSLGKDAGNSTKSGLLSTQGSTTSSFNQYGQQIMQGLYNGLSQGKGWVTSLTSSIAQQIKTNFAKVQGIRSPSKVFMEYGQYIDEGLVLGLRSKEDAIYGTMDRIASGLAFDTNDFFNLSPTLNNTATSSSNVTVQVYNNMETDLMGNLINNIKTYSNGSKNDYNYGMA